MIQILATCTLRNTGDRACLPHLYYPIPDPRILWIGEPSRDPNGLLIVGGGGLFRRGSTLAAVYASLQSHRGPKVLWGAGLNNDDVGPRDSYPGWLSQFTLCGVRDIIPGLRWVPCVSCASPLFDKAWPITQDVVVYHGAETIEDCDGIPAGTCESNWKMAQVIEFLASAETVVTSSYHGWYWATLLGRKVVLVPGKRCSKYHFLPIEPTRAAKDDWRCAVSDARAFPDFLSRCREATASFATEVRQRFFP